MYVNSDFTPIGASLYFSPAETIDHSRRASTVEWM